MFKKEESGGIIMKIDPWWIWALFMLAAIMMLK
jgi:hypothetical protein